ncbi:hypothetical protein TRV_06483, partial [Trichophyton verrucosum HKI 0517]
YPFGPLVGSADRGALQRINSTYRELGEIGGYHRYKARLPPLSRGTVVSLTKAKNFQPTNIYISSEKKREILNAASPVKQHKKKNSSPSKKYFFLTAAITPIESFPCHIAPTVSFPLLNLKEDDFGI